MLFPYQLIGAKWLSEKNFALLADEMGLGKSAQSIRAADTLFAKRILIVCPAVARRTWLQEFVKFSNARRSFYIIESRELSEPLKDKSVICSFDLVDVVPSDETFDVLIIDEAHYLKSISAKRSKLILGKQGLVHRAKRVWALTGTPAPNHAGELWPLLYVFGATPLPYDGFVEKFCTTIQTARGPKIIGNKSENIPVLRHLLSKIMLRRKKEDVMKELPPITYADITVEPGLVDIGTQSSFVQYCYPPERIHELNRILELEKKMVEEATRHTHLGAEGVKVLEALAKSVSTLRRYNGLQKVEAVADIIEEELTFGAYDKVVVFAIHRDVIEALRVRLSKFGAVTLYGGTDPEKRDKHVKSFQNNPKTRVFIGNIQAAGTNITLTAAHNVVFVEQEWTPGNNAQAAMRCHRIGQTKPVFVRVVSLSDSLDQRVNQVLKRKTRDLTEIFLEGKNSLPLEQFSTTD